MPLVPTVRSDSQEQPPPSIFSHGHIAQSGQSSGPASRGRKRGTQETGDKPITKVSPQFKYNRRPGAGLRGAQLRELIVLGDELGGSDYKMAEALRGWGGRVNVQR